MRADQSKDFIKFKSEVLKLTRNIKIILKFTPLNEEDPKNSKVIGTTEKNRVINYLRKNNHNKIVTLLEPLYDAQIGKLPTKVTKIPKSELEFIISLKLTSKLRAKKEELVNLVKSSITSKNISTYTSFISKIINDIKKKQSVSKQSFEKQAADKLRILKDTGDAEENNINLISNKFEEIKAIISLNNGFSEQHINKGSGRV